MQQLLADEDFPFPAVLRLRELGFDIVTLQNLGLAGIGLQDIQVLELARILKRAVVTCNRRDFIKLHKETSSHFGILVCTRNPDHISLAETIHFQLEKSLNTENVLLKIYKPL
ncbi:MAG: DUF5615 family PIN-like protein [Bacteroidota bacterium]